MLFDSHCHWDHPDLQAQQPGLWQACVQNDVHDLLIPATVAANWQRQIDLSKLHPHWHLALGLHPYFMDQHAVDHVAQLQQLVAEHKPVAIGEIGLDWHLPEASWAEQESLLLQQLQIAKQAKLPLILHVRKCHDRVLKLLRQQQINGGGIVHAFGGNAQQAQGYAELGFKLGVGGSVTYDRAKKLRRLFAELPLEWLVLETDAPYMPMQHQRRDGQAQAVNKPSHLPYVLDVLVTLRRESRAEIARQTRTNTLQVLNFI